MDKNILVTYASKYGATQEIAAKIAEVLHQAGFQSDVLPVKDVRDLHPYKAIILGSSVYIDKWAKEAVAFLKTNEKILADRMVWLFSSGPTGEGDPAGMWNGLRLPAALRPIADRIHPRDIAVFHGNINPDKVSAIEKWMVKSLVKKPIGDFRDWKAIATWSTKIADVLKDGKS